MSPFSKEQGLGFLEKILFSGRNLSGKLKQQKFNILDRWTADYQFFIGVETSKN